MSLPTIDIFTMGCSKNLVDSEMLLSKFASAGFTAYHDPDHLHGGVAVVNTCGFIGDAKQESIDLILRLCDDKESGLISQLFVMGCLSQRYKEELRAEIPQVDRFYGKFDWTAMCDDLLKEIPQGTLALSQATSDAAPRQLTTPSHYSYIKISEGCNRRCAYCAIPIITGAHKSRPMEEIVAEVRALVERGVKEFQVIAQELTCYGVDLYGEQRLPQLVEALADIDGVEWLRLHYAYPDHFPRELLRVMRERKNVCKYLDIALQHISDGVLERMQRHITKAETLALLEEIRREVPGICLRTTLMVGFCGETETEFEELKAFVRQARFERMGAFAYSEEEGTYAALHYSDDVPEATKQARLDELMAIQQGIAAEVAQGFVGHTLRTIIDCREGDFYVGRTEYDSPEVDCEVLIPAEEGELLMGSFHEVTITDADEFDLYGTCCPAG